MLLQMTEFVSGEQVPRGLSFFCSSAVGVPVQGHGQREEGGDHRPDVHEKQVRKPKPKIGAHAHFLLEIHCRLNLGLFVHRTSIEALLYAPLWAGRLATETMKHRFSPEPS